MHLLSPVGPLPASVYWRRRAFVLGGVLLALVLLRACTSGNEPQAEQLRTAAPGTAPSAPASTPVSGPATPAPGSTTTGPATPGPDTSGPDTSGPDTAGPATPGPTAAGPAAGSVPRPPRCPDRQLSLTAGTDAVVYPLGSTPRLRVTVRNTGAAPCTRALGPAAVELRVVSGSDRIWSTDDCSPDKGQGVVTLAPQAQRTVAAVWPGRRSVPGCTSPGAQASPGTYRVVGLLGSYVSQESAFTLTGG